MREIRRLSTGAVRRMMVVASLLLVLASRGVALTYTESRLQLPGDVSDWFARDLDGDGRMDMVVTSIWEVGLENERRVGVFYQRADGSFARADGSMRPAQSWKASKRAAVLVVGDFTADPGVEIGALTRRGLEIRVRDKAGRYAEKPRRLLVVRTFFDFPSRDSLPFWDYARDLSGDGLDDLVVPQSSNYQVFVQPPGRVWKRPRARVVAARAGHSISSGPGRLVEASTSLPRLLVRDFNGDGRLDLLTSYNNRLLVYMQHKGGAFDMEPSVSQELGFLKEGFEKGVRDEYDAKRIEIEDFDADGRADLFVLRNKGKVGDLLASRTELLYYRGTGAGVGRRHGEKTLPQQVLVFDGVGAGTWFPDLDGDGDLDLAVAVVRVGLLQGIKTGLFEEITVTYMNFLFDDKKKLFSSTPDFTTDLVIPKQFFEMSRMGKANPAARFPGDFTGDGKVDMLRVAPHGKRLALEVHAQTGDTGLFSGNTFGYESAAVQRFGFEPGREVKVLDLNGDGLADVVSPGESTIDVAISRGGKE